MGGLDRRNLEFEISVNSYGGQTFRYLQAVQLKFESSVNSYGGQTQAGNIACSQEFESSVNSYGGQTGEVLIPYDVSLRVV